jgi:phosphoesterase RecJ-like protein
MSSKSVGSLKLWGRAFDRLKIDPETKIATTAITHQDMQELEVEADAAEGVSNFLNGLKGVRAVIVLSERTPGVIKGSCRTTDPCVDVSKLAMLLGGGGHKKAAGFSFPGKLEETATGWKIVN